MPNFNTTQNVAIKLGISIRRVQQLIKELGIEPEYIGKTQILSDADIRKLEKRKTQRGAAKKASK